MQRLEKEFEKGYWTPFNEKAQQADEGEKEMEMHKGEESEKDSAKKGKKKTNLTETQDGKKRKQLPLKSIVPSKKKKDKETGIFKMYILINVITYLDPQAIF